LEVELFAMKVAAWRGNATCDSLRKELRDGGESVSSSDLNWKVRQELIRGNQMIKETSENVHVTKNDHVMST
jgi:hypothetical protein